MALRHPVGVQLYSGRKFPPLDSQLAVVAHFGFTHVNRSTPDWLSNRRENQKRKHLLQIIRFLQMNGA